MRIAIISDTHGFLKKGLKALKKIEDLDVIIHLGDHVSDAKKIEQAMNIETFYVRGNCDYLEVDVDQEKLIKLGGKTIFITHGHQYNVKNGISSIFYRGKELNADIILFGHSHMALKVEHENVLILNPGSPEEPRNGNIGSIGLLEILNNDIKSEIISI